MLKSFCTTVSGYAGFHNPLPFHGQNLYYLSIGFESERRLEESEFVHDDYDVQDDSAVNMEMATVMACAAPSALMSVLKGERKGPISFCADPSCLHEANGGLAGVIEANGKGHNDGSRILRRYCCTEFPESQQQEEVVWFRLNEHHVRDENTLLNAPLSFRSIRMKMIVTTAKNKDVVEKLYDTSQDKEETINLASTPMYGSVVETGRRMLYESRDRCVV